jgi:hypothetical protein
MIAFDDDAYLIITPEGYQYKVSEYCTEMCDKLDNYNGKEIYEQRKKEIEKHDRTSAEIQRRAPDALL